MTKPATKNTTARKGNPLMKIDLTKEEYRNLIDMLYIANWVMNAFKSETEPEMDKYQQLQQKIYARAQEAGMANLIEFKEELQTYYETEEFEEESSCHEIIDEYDNNQFWDRLVEELTVRDLHAELDARKIKEKDADSYFERFSAIQKKYTKEFEKNGLNNLMLKIRKTAKSY
jgi:hypothetical protein